MNGFFAALTYVENQKNNNNNNRSMCEETRPGFARANR
jgi:hypothetical protein